MIVTGYTYKILVIVIFNLCSRDIVKNTFITTALFVNFTQLHIFHIKITLEAFVVIPCLCYQYASLTDDISDVDVLIKK